MGDAAANSNPGARRRSRWRRWLFWLPVWFVLITTAQVLLLRFIDPPTSAFMMARRLEAVVEGDRDFVLRHAWPGGRGSGNLALAVVAAEDQQFPVHSGFDFNAIQKAAKRNAREGARVRGGSTITQQLAKNLFLWKGSGATRWVRKALEAWYTVLIELLWPKQRILEVYMDVVEFGDGVYGAEAAARRFYGKPAAALTPSEAARLAAVLPNPRRYSVANPGPYVQARSRKIQRQMRQLGTGYLKDLD